MRAWSNSSVAFVLVMFASGGWMLGYRAQPVRGAGEAPQAAVQRPDYTVVSSDAHSIIVTDNRAHALYYYALDEDDEFGAKLKLRGKVDLSQVGKAELVPELPSKK
jgi:hypothetical protein